MKVVASKMERQSGSDAGQSRRS